MLAGKPGGKLRYAANEKEATESVSQDRTGEVGFLKIRYKDSDASSSKELEFVIQKADSKKSFESASSDLRFATAVYCFGEILRAGQYSGDCDLKKSIEIARTSRGSDEDGYRAEAARLMDTALSLVARGRQ